MPDITLYMAPTSCARVIHILLEEIGVDYALRPIRFMRGEHRSPAFLDVNPRGQVPVLEVSGRRLTETTAIVCYLDKIYPGAGILPPAPTQMDSAQQIADLSLCGATLHALVARIRVPHFLAGAEAAQALHDNSIKGMRHYADLVEKRFAGDRWWYGDLWSAVDVFLYWVFWRIDDGSFPLADYPAVRAHRARIEARPATQRALLREAEIDAQLVAEGSDLRTPDFAAGMVPD